MPHLVWVAFGSHFPTVPSFARESVLLIQPVEELAQLLWAIVIHMDKLILIGPSAATPATGGCLDSVSLPCV